MGMGFAPTWLCQVSPLLHKTTLTTGTMIFSMDLDRIELWPPTESKPLNRLPKNWHSWSGPRIDPACQIWWQSLQGNFWANGRNKKFCDCFTAAQCIV